MGEEKNVIKAIVLFVIGILGAIVGFIFAGFVTSRTNKSRISSDKTSAGIVDNGLRESKVGLERGKERIDAGTESIDCSIERLKESLRRLNEIEKRNNDISNK